MKKFATLMILVLLAGFSVLQAQTSTPATPTAPKDLGIEWEKKTHDFGEIPQNVPAKAEFLLTNTSDDPLILTNVKGSCGCTATGYSKDPIPPGETTTITATYNARRVGPFNKSVRVNTNRDAKTITLNIKGSVKAEEMKEAPKDN